MAFWMEESHGKIGRLDLRVYYKTDLQIQKLISWIKKIIWKGKSLASSYAGKL